MNLIIKILDEKGNHLTSVLVNVPDEEPKPPTPVGKIDHLPDVALVYDVSARSQGARLFGHLVRQYREAYRFTPKELAEKCGVHVSFINGIERGAQSPSVKTAIVILNETVSKRGVKKWMSHPMCDLRLRDLETNEYFYFRFAAAVQGQNRRN